MAWCVVGVLACQQRAEHKAIRIGPGCQRANVGGLSITSLRGWVDVVLLDERNFSQCLVFRVEIKFCKYILRFIIELITLIHSIKRKS